MFFDDIIGQAFKDFQRGGIAGALSSIGMSHMAPAVANVGIDVVAVGTHSAKSGTAGKIVQWFAHDFPDRKVAAMYGDTVWRDDGAGGGFLGNQFQEGAEAGITGAAVRLLVHTEVREIDGRTVVWVDVDASERRGALSSESSSQIQAGAERALAEQLPLIAVVRSSGADIEEGFSLGSRLLVFDRVRNDPQAPQRYGARITYDLPLKTD